MGEGRWGGGKEAAPRGNRCHRSRGAGGERRLAASESVAIGRRRGGVVTRRRGVVATGALRSAGTIGRVWFGTMRAIRHGVVRRSGHIPPRKLDGRRSSRIIVYRCRSPRRRSGSIDTCVWTGAIESTSRWANTMERMRDVPGHQAAKADPMPSSRRGIIRPTMRRRIRRRRWYGTRTTNAYRCPRGS